MRAKKISAEVIRSFSIQSSTLQAMSLGQKISKNPIPFAHVWTIGLEAFWTAESDISIRFFFLFCDRSFAWYISYKHSHYYYCRQQKYQQFLQHAAILIHIWTDTQRLIYRHKKSVAEQFYFCCSTKVCPKKFCTKIIFKKNIKLKFVKLKGDLHCLLKCKQTFTIFLPFINHIRIFFAKFLSKTCWNTLYKASS